MSPAQGGAPPGEEGATTRRRPAATALAAAVLAVLALATFLAIFFAQELKRRPALLLYPRGSNTITFQPLGTIAVRGIHHYVHLRVQVSVRARITVSIRSVRSGRTVWTFAPRELRGYRSSYPVWKGRTASGALAPPGDYRVVVHFASGQTVEPLVRYRLVEPGA